MKKNMTEFTKVGTIQRPVEEVRSHFADFKYHAQGNVHPQIKFEVQEQNPQKARFTQEVRILGMRQKDFLVNEFTPNGKMLTQVIDGPNKGFEIEFQFISLAPNSTSVEAVFRIPKVGVKKWLAPLFKVIFKKIADQALSEDKRDLEGGNYAAYLARGH